MPEIEVDGPGGPKDVIFQLLSAGPGPERNLLISHGFFCLTSRSVVVKSAYEKEDPRIPDPEDPC